MPAETIDEVVAHLDAIMVRARREESRHGYFAALYRNVTVRVRDGIAEGRFEDGPRMERLDVAFANRYLEAHDQHHGGSPCSRCWQACFDAAERWSPLILQHLLLGMNAHINLDLGIAAARTCPGPALAGLERDFREINDVLIEMLDDVQEAINRLSPWLGLLDHVGGGVDELIGQLGLTGAREGAWATARRLAPLAPDAQAAVIEEVDAATTSLAGLLLRPGPLLTAVALVVRLAERRSVPAVIDALSA